MPRELTVKQERFVAEYITNGGNGTQAAIAAGYAESGASVEANRLLANAKISNAIVTFRAEAAERAHITLENQTAELVKDRKLARENGQASAAIQATGLILKAHGLMTEDRKNERDPLTDAIEAVRHTERQRKDLH